MRVGEWVCCPDGSGYLQEKDGIVSQRKRHFKKNAVGQIKNIIDDTVDIWLIGLDEIWRMNIMDIEKVDVIKTGDKFNQKICNICHCLLPTEKFSRNQNNKHGIIRRPSCMDCRTDIDKRTPKSRQAKAAEKIRPQTGEAFKCPICQKRSIVGVTAKIVADHNHHTGNIRDFICDSCNTGLGRFKNGEDYLSNAIAYLKERDN
ncbi:MAG: endonuclease VII domain-containing protein [Alphaproteobacteria bacterium]|nr:endonuclease VII domain-containing protein [Alphaproteobacteria bacterium]